MSLLGDPKVYTMSLVYFLFLGATYVMVFYTPTLIKSWGIQDVFLVGLLAGVGPFFGIIGMVLIGRSSDKHLERRRHFFFTAVLAGVGLLIAVFTKGNVVPSLVGLSIMTIGMSAMTPIFFTALSEYLPKKTAAGGIALISSLGNLGPSVMPSITTWINSSTGNSTNSMYLVVALWLVAGLILLRIIQPAAVGSPQLAPA
jgi:MFS family permease